MLSTWKKSMLIFQCGSFYEIYGLVDYPNDPIWDYQRIMPNCTELGLKEHIKKKMMFYVAVGLCQSFLIFYTYLSPKVGK